VPEHCLGDHVHASVDSSVHDHGGRSHHQPANHEHNQDEKCCGLFGVTAIAPELLIVAAERSESSNLAVPRSESLLGSRGSRIDRPPRDLVSL
jgi:hypothetical protein